MKRLQDRVAIITGGASGIGLATAQRFVAEGARVVICDLQEELGQNKAEAIRKEGGDARFIRCDISNEADVESLFRTVIEAFGHVNSIVNSAFKTHIVDFLSLSSADLQQELDINLKGPFYLSQRVARHLVDHNMPGSIVNVTSVAAELSSGNQVAYSASKSGLAGLTRAMAIALAPHNIRVNAIAPGPTLTPSGEKVLLLPAVKDAMLSRVPLGRYSQASEQAAAVAFLTSDDASFITGETLFVDGGRMVLNHTMTVQNSYTMGDKA